MKQKRSSTSNVDEDSPLGAELLNQIPSHETVARFTDDGTYDSQVVHEVCYRRRVIHRVKGQGCVKTWHSLIAMKPSGMPAIGPGYLETLERLSPKATGGDENKLLQAPWRKVMTRTFDWQVTEIHIPDLHPQSIY